MTRRPDRLVFVFADELRGRPAAASFAELQEIESGRDIEFLSPIDPSQISAVLPQFNSSVLVHRDSLLQEVQQLQGQLNTSQQSLEQAMRDRDDAIAIRSTLEARIAELESLLNPPGPDTSTAAGLKQYLANVRYEHEVSGFNVGDQFISTNRDELAHWFARFFDAFNWLQGNTASNPSGLYPYKPRGGSVVAMLTAEQAVRAYQCIAWYVNACIATEGQLIEAINAGGDLVAIKAMIDNAATWPQRQFDWVPPS